MDILNSVGQVLFNIPEGWEPLFGDTDLLAGAILRDAQLMGIDLGGANLSNACLVGADLYHAFLYGATLKGANMERASLRGADLEDADCRSCNLAGADLSPSNIGTHTRLGGTNLQGANLQGTNLHGALYDSSTIFPEDFIPEEHGMVTFEQIQEMIRQYRTGEAPP